jgi:hypothetical protein
MNNTSVNMLKSDYGYEKVSIDNFLTNYGKTKRFKKK